MCTSKVHDPLGPYTLNLKKKTVFQCYISLKPKLNISDFSESRADLQSTMHSNGTSGERCIRKTRAESKRNERLLKSISKMNPVEFCNATLTTPSSTTIGWRGAVVACHVRYPRTF